MSVETLTTISPTTNGPIPYPRRHFRTAQTAFRSFSRSTTLAQRQEIVAKALAILLKKKDALAREVTEQMGRPIAYTGAEITTAVKRGEYLNRVAGEVLGDKIEADSEAGFKRYLKKEPVGVVLVLFVFSVRVRYPYLILVNSLIPALLAGNAVILKPSPQTPTVVEQMAAIFAEAGLPQNVIQYFHSGSPTSIETLIRSPLINHICFTGSVAGGLGVQKAAADRIVSVGLELGGNDPAYVRDDVDVAWAAEEIVDGAIFNSGQSCCAIERVYVHEKIHDVFVEEVKKVLSKYRSQGEYPSHIDDAVKKGAKDETPANSTFENMPPEGNFVKPTLLTGVNHDMVVMTDETFGPIIPVMKVKDDDEAIRLMNDSDLGLTASVWTKDVGTAEDLIERIEAGTVFVNRADYPSPDLAWTGWKNSGRGVTLSKFGFDQFVKLKSFHLKDYPK
ncbi:succinate-semialdehyde dehydrogenase [Coccidioides immitis RMSCC 3703]|uniref:aldehyde dehydrogenase (NAD(+)) n=1 Tax=Coccidioides immitis RMSCC 3703 TaxID=454286 RepID=A0A0J8RBJ8_COCIT|nr:succinate-semialdehyde dehydrogenase [Coccidioides immitis RMSCC 3703]